MVLAYGDEINLVQPGFNSGWTRYRPYGLEDYNGGPLRPKNPINMVNFNEWKIQRT